MSIYNWIQKTIFNIYEEWHMKSSNYDRKGFHIDGINNSLKNMQDGVNVNQKVSHLLTNF
jgi:hypothetical protein